MNVLKNIEPQEVFRHFEALSMVPRRTFRNEKIAAFCVDFAKQHRLEYVQDEVGNVIIYKPGTAGYEDSEPVIIQGHLDMVATRTVESTHDFDSEPLSLFVDGDLIGAHETTLGGDDGIALAYGMALLASDDIPHPPLEVLFTVDEEIGMAGAHGLDPSLLKGRMMLSIDGEEEGFFIVSCAGAYISDVVIPVQKADAEGTVVTIRIRDLIGGHSGNDIQYQRGNAHKIMGRILYTLSADYDYVLKTIHGGSGANVITQYSTAEVILKDEDAASFTARVNEMGRTIYDEFFGQEPGLTIRAEASEHAVFEAFDADSTRRVIAFVYGAPHGVQTYDRTIDGNVESSLNGGLIVSRDDQVRVSYQVRGSVESKLEEMMERLRLWCDLVGGHIETTGSYPSWAYKADSKLRPIMVNTYKRLFGEDAVLVNCHAGLEGGILMGKNPDFDIICFGPNMFNVHTAEERLQISSVARTWELIKEILKACR